MKDDPRQKDRNKKKRQNQLEAFVFQLLQRSLKKALDEAFDDLLKGLN